MLTRFLLLLSLVAAVYGQSAPTIAQTAAGIITMTHLAGGTNNSYIGVKTAASDTFPRFVVGCTNNANTPACGYFTCSSTSACTFGSAGNAPTYSSSTYVLTRPMASLNAQDPGFMLGDNIAMWGTGTQAPVNADVTPTAGSWSNVTLNVSQFTGMPSGLTLTITQAAPDVILMTFTGTANTNRQYSVGWREGSNTWPTWAASCFPVSTGNGPFCVFVRCTAFQTCVAAAGAELYEGRVVSRTSPAAVVSRTAVGPAAFTIVPGAQTNMLWYDSVKQAGDAATVLTASGNGWSLFTTAPTVTAAFPVTPAFPIAMATSDSSTLRITMTTNANKYGAVGWQRAGSLFSEYVVVCDPSQAGTKCADFTCTDAATCTASGYAESQVVSSEAATRVSVFRRALSPAAANSHKVVAGAQRLLWAEGNNTAAVAAPLAQAQDWKYFTANVDAFQGTRPTFNVSAVAATATNIALSVTTNANKYAMTGVNDGARDFPSFVTVCEPATQATCGIYTCTSRTACADSTVSGVTQTRDQTNRVATVTFPRAQLPASGDAYLYWIEKDVPSPFTLSNSLATSQTWATFLLSVGPLATNPTFNVTFSRSNDTTLVTTLVPGDAKMVFFGWRSSAAALFPTDAVICAPSVTSIGRCLDAACTSASACTARATSIYTANTATGTTATLTRTLTAGDVKLAANTRMWLAWDLIDTPSGTTALNASTLQSRSTWKYYEVAVPAVGGSSSASSFVPSLVAVLMAVAYILA